MTASYDGDVRVWVNSAKDAFTVASFHQPVMSVSFSPSGNRLLVAGILPSFYVYTIEDRSAVQEFDTISVNEREKQFDGSLSIPLNSALFMEGITRSHRFRLLVAR